MGIHSDVHLALLAIRNTMSWRYSLYSHSIFIVCLSFVCMFSFVGLILGSICVSISRCSDAPAKGLYTPRKYQAVSVEFQGEHTHDMDTGLCYLSGN
jgi:hypothetical protein